MAYIKTIWENEKTPLSAENLNHMEEGITNTSILADSLSLRMKSAEDRLSTCEGDTDVPAARLTAMEREFKTNSLGTFKNEKDLETALDLVIAGMNSAETRRIIFGVGALGEVPIGEWSWFGTIFKSSAGYAILSVESGFNNRVTQITKALSNGVWQPAEWLNPPMKVGVEYRTTERYMESPVYVKIVEYKSNGATGDTTKTTDISISHGISGFGNLIEANIAKSNYQLPLLLATGGFTAINSVDATNIIMRCHLTSWAASTWRFFLKYTKT